MSSSFIGNQPLTQAQRNVVIHTVTATATYNVNYTVGFLDVLLNGVTLSPEDYTAIDGLTVVLNSPTEVGDSLVTISWGTFQLADTIAPDDPRLATAWALIDGISDVFIGTPFNMGTIISDSAGHYSVTFDIPMENTDYIIMVTPSSGSAVFSAVSDSAGKTVNGFSFYSFNNAGTPTDCSSVGVQIFGGKN